MNKQRIKSLITNILFVFILLSMMSLFSNGQVFTKNTDITYDEFLKMVDEEKVDEVEITNSGLNITAINDKTVYYTGYMEYDNLVEKLYEANVKFKKTQSSDFGQVLLSIILTFGPILLIIWVFSRMFSKEGGGPGGVFSMGKSKASLDINKNTGITFKDVAGQEEAKEQLTEIIDYLHNPRKYQEIGAKIPKGALLVGPPGTGKTLLAKAVAGEANVPFFSVTGSDFIEMFVGVGASRVRDLFEQAKQNAPCIIFIDEVDAIAKSRDGIARSGSNDERDQTLNQLLSEMDGFDSSKGIIILAATNRPEILDKAFLRAGRFDRKVIVERPDFKGRVETLKVHSKNVKLDSTVDFKAIAYATTGSVGADLENIVNEAALRAVKFGRKAVIHEDFMEAVETVFAGKEKKDRIMSDKEKRLVAYHEVGHAVVSACQKNTSPVQKITIVPRTKGSLGYTLQVPEEEKFLSSKDEMLEDITTFLGGRCAEEIIFNTITTGASNDIEKATEIARQMITIYGMSDKFDMVALESIQNRYLDGTPIKNCSETTATKIDDEVLSIIKSCHNKAKKIIENNRDLMDEVANYLIEKESITGDEFMEIFNMYHPEIELKTTTIEDLDKKPPKEKIINIEKPKTEKIVKETPKEDIKKQEEIPEKKQEEKIVETKKEIPLVIKTDEADEVKKDIEDTQQVEEKPKVIRIEEPKEPQKEEKTKVERPSASVLGPKKKKKKGKATASDMKSLIDSVQNNQKKQEPKKEEPKKKLYEEAKEEKPVQKEANKDIDNIKAESAKPATNPKVDDYANNKNNIDDITEDMF